MNKVGKLGFLGAGRMAQAMAKGFISADLVKPEAIIASVHPSDIVSLEAAKKLGIETTVKNDPVVENSDVIFVSVKPQIISTVLQEIKAKSANKLFISVAMGVTLRALEQDLSHDARVIRVMSNTPVLVKTGCSVFVRGTKATDEDAKYTKYLLETIGTCEEVSEYLFDPITALSGSGPAYVYVMIEALADGAVRMGIPRDMAYRLASQTVMGSGRMVRDSEEHPGVLKDNVTSPAGSTAAGLKYLEASGFRSALAGAVETATLRCKQISGT